MSVIVRVNNITLRTGEKIRVILRRLQNSDLDLQVLQ